MFLYLITKLAKSHRKHDENNLDYAAIAIKQIRQVSLW